MRTTITISLPELTKQKLDNYIKKQRLNRSDVVREALRRYFVTEEFRRLRGLMIPEAEKRGLYKDEDVFKQVS